MFPWSSGPMDPLLPSISVCIPARNEEATIGHLVAELQQATRDRGGFIDELIVFDHRSTDETSRVAAHHGARVIDADAVAANWGPAMGKGDVLWRSLVASRGDIVVWVDADLTNLTWRHVADLVTPLISDRSIHLCKAAFTRSMGGVTGEGGRVTELVAKPALRLLAPAVTHLAQPLSGQCAIRRSVAEQLVFEVDYGVEIGLLLDIVDEFGPDSVTQVSVGSLDHRHRSLAELSIQSEQVLRALLSRTGLRGLQAHAIGRPPVASLRFPAAWSEAIRGIPAPASEPLVGAEAG